MELIDVRIQDDVTGTLGISASTSAAHWLTADTTGHRHGSGLDGVVTVAGQVTVHSLVRGAWEMRLVRVESLEAPTAAGLRLRIGGWPVTGAAPLSTATGQDARAAVESVSSAIRTVHGAGVPSVSIRPDSTPLAGVTAVPAIDYPVVIGEWTGAVLELTGVPHGSRLDSSVRLVADGEYWAADITWPDGAQSSSRLTDHRTAAKAER